MNTVRAEACGTVNRNVMVVIPSGLGSSDFMAMALLGALVTALPSSCSTDCVSHRGRMPFSWISRPRRQMVRSAASTATLREWVEPGDVIDEVGRRRLARERVAARSNLRRLLLSVRIGGLYGP